MSRGSNGADAVAPAMQAEAAGPMIEAGKLKAFVDRIERLDGEALTVGLDKRGVFDEAKKAGVNTKMLRRYLAERKRDAKDSKTDKDALDEFRALLGEPGATYRSVAAKLGMTKTKLHRLVPKHQNGTREMTADDLGEWLPPHAPETGVIIEDAAPQTLGDASAPVAEPVHSSACPPQPLSEGGDGIGHQYLDIVQPNIAASEKSCGGVESRHAGQGAGRLEGLGVQPGVKGAGASVSGAQAQEREALSQSHKAASVHSTDSSDQAGVAPGPQEPDWDAIVASQPPQLRRVPA